MDLFLKKIKSINHIKDIFSRLYNSRKKSYIIVKYVESITRTIKICYHDTDKDKGVR